MENHNNYNTVVENTLISRIQNRTLNLIVSNQTKEFNVLQNKYFFEYASNIIFHFTYHLGAQFPIVINQEKIELLLLDSTTSLVNKLKPNQKEMNAIFNVVNIIYDVLSSINEFILTLKSYCTEDLSTVSILEIKYNQLISLVDRWILFEGGIFPYTNNNLVIRTSFTTIISNINDITNLFINTKCIYSYAASSLIPPEKMYLLLKVLPKVTSSIDSLLEFSINSNPLFALNPVVLDDITPNTANEFF